MALAPDSLIDGKYRVIRAIGEGGVGVVYVAEHTFLKKFVALKVLREEMVQYPEVAQRFETEARATSLIEHENIVRVTDFGRTPAGELYLVMELLTGSSLADEMANQPKLTKERALWVTRLVLTGLEAAHGQGIIHRDLKPENVFIVQRPDGTDGLKIVDFGIAKLKDETSTRLTQTGTVLGTPQYMAPEQARGEPDLDHRVDLHAVGVMLFEMLCGLPPYQGENYNLVLFQILSGNPPLLTTYAPEIDAELAAIVMKTFHPQRSERFQSARELRQRITQYQQVQHGAAMAPLLASLGSAMPSLAPPITVTRAVASAAPAPAPAPVLAVPREGGSGRVERSFEAPPRGALESMPSIPIEVQPRGYEPAWVAGAAKATSIPLEGRAATSSRAAASAEPRRDGREGTRPRSATAVTRRPAPRSSIWLLLLLGAVIAGAGAYWKLVLAEPSSGGAPVNITVDGLPAQAVVTFDDVRRFISPFQVPQSSQPHELRIECPGFRSRVIQVVPSSDQYVDGRLERLGGP